MTDIIHRSALVAYGRNPAPNVAMIVIDGPGAPRRIVTWDDVMTARRERQRLILARKLHVEPWRAVKLWVAYYDQSLMGGWQAMLEGFEHHTWIDRDGKGFRKDLMEMFPMGLALGTEKEQWEAWKPAFAQSFKRRIQDRRHVGVVYLWRRGNELRKA